jgi:hypothetical protein
MDIVMPALPSLLFCLIDSLWNHLGHPMHPMNPTLHQMSAYFGPPNPRGIDRCSMWVEDVFWPRQLDKRWVTRISHTTLCCNVFIFTVLKILVRLKVLTGGRYFSCRLSSVDWRVKVPRPVSWRLWCLLNRPLSAEAGGVSRAAHPLLLWFYAFVHPAHQPIFRSNWLFGPVCFYTGRSYIRTMHRWANWCLLTPSVSRSILVDR